MLNLHGEVPSDPEKVRSHSKAYPPCADGEDLEHFYTECRETLSHPPSQARCRFPPSPYRSRTCYHFRSHRDGPVPSRKCRMHHHSAPPLSHHRYRRPSATSLLQAIGEGAKGPSSVTECRQIWKPQILPRQRFCSSSDFIESSRSGRGERAIAMRCWGVHQSDIDTARCGSTGELRSVRQARGIRYRTWEKVLRCACERGTRSQAEEDDGQVFQSTECSPRTRNRGCAILGREGAELGDCLMRLR